MKKKKVIIGGISSLAIIGSAIALTTPSANKPKKYFTIASMLANGEPTLNEGIILDPSLSFSKEDGVNFLGNTPSGVGNDPIPNIMTNHTYSLKRITNRKMTGYDMWDHRGDIDASGKPISQHMKDTRPSGDWWKDDDAEGSWKAWKMTITFQDDEGKEDSIYLLNDGGKDWDGEDEDYSILWLAPFDTHHISSGKPTLFGTPIDLSFFTGASYWSLHTGEQTIMSSHDYDDGGDNEWSNDIFQDMNVTGDKAEVRNGATLGRWGQNFINHINKTLNSPSNPQRRHNISTTIDYSKVLPYVFTILKNSTQQKDFSRGGQYWLSKTNPPKLHIGLNNELFKAIKEKEAMLKNISSVAIDNYLTNDQRIILKKLIKEGKVNKDMFADVKKSIKEGNTPNLIVQPWFQWVGDNAPTINGTKVVDWLGQTKNLGNKKITYGEMLSQLLNKADVSVNYSVDGMTHKVTIPSLSDFTINLSNSDTSLFKPSIVLNGFEIKYNDPQGTTHTISNINPYTNEDMGKYFIDWNSNTYTYSAYYQPNKLDIANDITFTPTGSRGEYYDKDLIRNTTLKCMSPTEIRQLFLGLEEPKYNTTTPYIQNYRLSNHFLQNGIEYKLIYFARDRKQMILHSIAENGKETQVQAHWDKTKGEINIRGNRSPISLLGKLPNGVTQTLPKLRNLNDRAYSSFFYETIVGGKKLKYPFIQPKANPSEWDLNKWITTGAIDGIKGETLEAMLKRKGLTYNKGNIIYILDQVLHMSINPYSAKDPQGQFLITPSFKVLKVEDSTEGNKVQVLLDHTGARLSNSFNDGFGIDREGRPTNEGLLGEGAHNLSIKLENYGSNDVSYRFYIDKTPPQPKIDVSNNIKEDVLYYKDEESNYERLYASITEANTLLKEEGIREAKLSWVDSEGTWYSKALDIGVFHEGDKYLQQVLMTIDYQGLFKLTYTDVANNVSSVYLWLQQPSVDGEETLIAQAEIDKADKGHLVGVAKNGANQHYWLDGVGSTLHIHNLISNGIEYEKLNSKGEWVAIANGDITTTTKPQNISSVGGTINSQNQPHSLAGDELAPLITGSNITTSSSATKFYETEIVINVEGKYRVKVLSNIYTQTNGTYLPYNQTLLIDVKSQYTLDNIGTDGWKDTPKVQQGHTFNDNHLVNSYDKSWDVDIKHLPLNSKVNIINNFLEKDTLNIEYSPLWYDWYKDVTSATWNGTEATFLNEGKYKISYTDKLGNNHTYSYVVFDWPNRDFTKYGVSHKVDVNGKPQIIVEEFYNTTGIASSMESRDYEITGSVTKPFDWKPQGYETQLIYSPVSFHYAEATREVYSDTKPTNLPSWAKVTEGGDYTYTEEDHLENGLSVKGDVIHTKKWIITGGGNTNLAIDFDKGSSYIEVTYQVTGIIHSSHIPPVEDGLVAKGVSTPQASSITELEKTYYGTGAYLDLYELSNHRENMLVDNDNNPSTIKVHLLEDQDHFNQQLKEWIANGGTINSFWENKGNQNFGTNQGNHKTPKTNETNNNNADDKKSDQGAFFGAMFGGLFGGMALIGSSAYLINKRKGMGFGKTLKPQSPKVKTPKPVKTPKAKK